MGIFLVLLALSVEMLTKTINQDQRSWNFFLFFSPAVFTLLILVISWKQPLAGGLVFSFLSMATFFIEFFFNSYGTQDEPADHPLSIPLFCTGIMYLLSYYVHGRSNLYQSKT